MLECIMVGIGGFIGSICRYLIGLLPIETSSGFPVKTLVINVAGSFLISLVAVLSTRDKSLSPQIALMLKTGICGGFTTFSTFAFETSNLIKTGHTAVALAYVFTSIVFGTAAIFAAQMLVK